MNVRAAERNSGNADVLAEVSASQSESKQQSAGREMRPFSFPLRGQRRVLPPMNPAYTIAI